MNEQTDTVNQRRKDQRVLFLLLIPVFYFFSLLFMGRRTKRDGYRLLGIFSGVMSLLSVLVSIMGLVYRPLYYAIVLHIGSWALCVMYTLKLRRKYLQVMQWQREDATEERSPLVFQKSFRLRNSLWRFWSCIPLLGGLSTYFMGRRLGHKKLKWVGIGSNLIVLTVFVALGIMPRLGKTAGNVLMVLMILLVYSCICGHLLLSSCYFEDYLDATAKMWEEDFRDYPVMEDTGWRIKNSLWQIITCIPYIGTMGLFYVGAHRQNGKVQLGALLLLAADMFCVVAPTILMENEALVKAWPNVEVLAGTIGMLWIFVYALIIFFGAVIRWDMLWIKARMLDERT